MIIAVREFTISWQDSSTAQFHAIARALNGKEGHGMDRLRVLAEVQAEQDARDDEHGSSPLTPRETP